MQGQGRGEFEPLAPQEALTDAQCMQCSAAGQVPRSLPAPSPPATGEHSPCPQHAQLREERALGEN